MSNVIQSTWNKTKTQLTKAFDSPLAWGTLAGFNSASAILAGRDHDPVLVGLNIGAAGINATIALFERAKKKRANKPSSPTFGGGVSV